MEKARRRLRVVSSEAEATSSAEGEHDVSETVSECMPPSMLKERKRLTSVGLDLGSSGYKEFVKGDHDHHIEGPAPRVIIATDIVAESV